MREAINERIQRVLDHGRYIMGPEVEEMESALSNFCGVQHCVAVSSGTEALLISLMSLGVGPGDEVITTPFTFVATVETIVMLGATPVVVDIEPDTCNIDATRIEAAVSDRTRAIIPVSLYGQVADMSEINQIASRHDGIAVIEDAAQSFGATYQGRRSGSLSTLGCVSFFPSKPLGCYGDGGAIFTDNDALAQACREIRIHGQSARYLHSRVGVGGRMDTIQCAVVLAKLAQFSEEVARRKTIGDRYASMIRGADLPIRLLEVRPDRDCVWAQFTVLVQERDRIRDQLSNRGIPTAVHYPVPLNRQPAYVDRCRGMATPVADDVAARVLSLPMSAYLTQNDQDAVVHALVESHMG